RELVASLAGGDQSFSSIEPTPAMRARWTKAVGQQTTPCHASRSSSLDAGFVRTVWRELIRPSRYAWSGLAALWIAMLVINTHLSNQPMARSSASPQEILQAWKEQNRVFAEWDRPHVISPRAPAYVPRPRSQKDQDGAVI